MNHRLRIKRWAFGAILAPFFLNNAADAADLYSQAPKNSGDAIAAEYSATGEFGWQNAESYSLQTPSTITTIRWWGTGVSDTGLFVVRHFVDLISGPDDFDILTGSITQTPASAGSNPLVDGEGTGIFQFDLQLSSALTLGGSGYLSVFFNSEQESWNWLESAVYDGQSAYRGQDNVAWDFQPPDLSMALIGDRVQNIPEPNSLLLFGIAALGGFAARRRRQA